MVFAAQLAITSDLPTLLPMVKAYHNFETIKMTDATREKALYTLLSNSSLGKIWLILSNDRIVGYIALTFGYSIEFGGKDAFIDEFYIQPEFRHQGLGQQTLSFIQQEARTQKIYAIHLEVAVENKKAQNLYSRANFQLRNTYNLMSVHLDRPSQ